MAQSRANLDFVGWMYDIARDQSPTEDQLDSLCRKSIAAGYNAVGLYLEHRFAYKSAPWAAGPGAVQPAWIRRIQSRYSGKGFRIIPFLETLGHMEGFLRVEGGQSLAEAPTSGQGQICPSNPAAVKLAKGLVSDAIDTFSAETIHLGGDETWQLGQCEKCKAREAKIGKAGIYAEHYAPLCQMVLDRGKRPAIWADMLLAHPEAVQAIPKQTLLFDWHYDRGPAETTRKLMDAGFDVVCCPTVHVFDSNWSDVDATYQNIDEHAKDAGDLRAKGVLVTSWEYNYLASFSTYVPLIMAAGRRITKGESWQDAMTHAGSSAYAKAAGILGHDIPFASELLRPGNGPLLRYHFAMRLNPFYLWLAWRGEIHDCAPRVLKLCDTADREVPKTSALRFPIALYRAGVRWTLAVDRAAEHYRARRFSQAQESLRQGKAEIHSLKPHVETSIRAGGALPDRYRLQVLERNVDEVIVKISQIAALYQESKALPAFESVVDGGYVAGDQAAWRTGQGR